jgi:hypothetical protein
VWWGGQGDGYVVSNTLSFYSRLDLRLHHSGSHFQFLISLSFRVSRLLLQLSTYLQKKPHTRAPLSHTTKLTRNLQHSIHSSLLRLHIHLHSRLLRLRSCANHTPGRTSRRSRNQHPGIHINGPPNPVHPDRIPDVLGAGSERSFWDENGIGI